MTSHSDDVLDDVSISCQYISNRVIVNGLEAPRKVTRYVALWVQVACMAAALEVLRIVRPYDMPGIYQCSIVAAFIIRTPISTGRVIWLGYTRLYLVYKLYWIANFDMQFK